ncbi:acyl-coenzyme A diphosphatase FITM2-like [Ptychodera flava]|uniref:acyl-coenzyme A diphosphatase FITM2-like n=1 Tax=Ptychodera flava TaxID=63121 RepID=UPI00396A4A93
MHFLRAFKESMDYVIIVAIGCAIHDLTDPPETYFSDKNNFLNQYFVKLSWGWTCGVALVFLLPASYIVRNGDGWKIAKDSLRLVVGTLEWYCWVGLFFWIEDATGQCSGGEQYSTKKSCVRSGHQWDGYDISGHTFLLIHCALLVWEELSYYMKLETRSKSKSQIKKKPYLHLFVRFTVLLMTLLALLWEFMLVWTQVYFHTTSHKAIALAVALGNWYITYRVLYGKLFPDMHTRITGKEGKPVL